jgi:tetratricopeptide (TPR) repeat protein
VAIFSVAIAYRAVCYYAAGKHPLFQFPVVDAGYHDAWAQRIAASDWLGHGPDDVFKPPLYPGFVGLLYHVFGRHIWMVQWSQHVLGALSCVLLAVLGGRLLGRRAGLVAGFVAAGYAPYVFFELQLLTPAVSLFLNLAALTILVRQWHALRPGLLLAAGLLLGLSVGVRPDTLLPAALVLLYLLLENRRMPVRQLATRALCVVAGILVTVLPIAVRNYMLVREVIPVSSNAGINFYVGNSAGADGISAVPVGLRWERLIGRVPQEVLEKPATASRWWARAARAEITADPVAALSRLGRKALAFFNRREFRNNICFHFLQRACPPLRISPLQFAVILPLAACGLVGLWSSRTPALRRAAALCALWVAGYWAAGVAFFVTARFRLPATPLLILPAGWALVECLAAVRQRRWRTLGAFTVGILGAGAICWPLWFGSPQDGWVRDNVNLSKSLSEAGDIGGAMKACRQALEIQPDDPDANFLLGRMLLPRDAPGAVEHFEIARRQSPESPSLLLATGQAYLQIGEASKSRRTLQELLDLSEKMNLWPKRDAWATAHIVFAEIDPPEAEQHWDKAWSIDPRTAAEAAFLQRRELPRVLETFRAEAAEKPWDWYSQANLGMALLESGSAAEAVQAFRNASELAPEKDGLAYQLARALLQAGGTQDALNILDRLARKLPRGGLRDQVEATRHTIREQN